MKKILFLLLLFLPLSSFAEVGGNITRSMPIEENRLLSGSEIPESVEMSALEFDKEERLHFQLMEELNKVEITGTGSDNYGNFSIERSIYGDIKRYDFGYWEKVGDGTLLSKKYEAPKMKVIRPYFEEKDKDVPPINETSVIVQILDSQESHIIIPEGKSDFLNQFNERDYQWCYFFIEKEYFDKKENRWNPGDCNAFSKDINGGRYFVINKGGLMEDIKNYYFLFSIEKRLPIDEAKKRREEHMKYLDELDRKNAEFVKPIKEDEDKQDEIKKSESSYVWIILPLLLIFIATGFFFITRKKQV